MEGFTQFKESYDRDGFVLCRNFLPPDVFKPLVEAIDRFILEVVPSLPDRAAYYQDKSRPETLKQIEFMEEFDPFFEIYQRDPRWNTLAKAVIGEEAITKGSKWFNKPPKTEHPTPPHQDNYYFKLSPPNVASLWLAIDPINEENGCLRYIPGSHRRGIRPHARTSILGFSQGITDYSTSDEEAEVTVDMRPGDAVVHHGEVIHRADPNHYATCQRRAFAMVFEGVSCKINQEAVRIHNEAATSQQREMGLKIGTK